MSEFGFELLEEQVVALAKSQLALDREQAPGESEIERLFFVALGATVQWGGGLAYSELRHFQTPEQEQQILAEEIRRCDIVDMPDGSPLKLYPAQSTIFIRPQAQIGAARVDFLVHVLSTRDEDPQWKRLIVECDGHDFHERTKEQAARDRSRDRGFTLDGFTCFRFTGSELWRNPIGCAE